MCEGREKTPLLAIVGPTATGKTEISLRVARNLGAEIISADSMLIYRGMDIGTAKPTREERDLVPHHMIDVADPGDTYNVALYSRQVKGVLKEIRKRGNLPLLAGGTGLYVRAVVDGYNFTDAGTDPELRSRLMRECNTLGRAALHERLKKIDPLTASRLHVNDVKRVVRALEVYYLTGKTLSGSAGREESPSFNLLMYGLIMNRKDLYSRIEERVDKMMAAGLVDEVRGLLAGGYTPELTSMQGLGYKEIILYLKGELTLDQAVELLKRNTRRFAKRQITWFGRDARIHWMDVGEKGVERVAAEITAGAEGVFKAASNDINRA
ncbi:MAG: tRNA (adenosine(37)-N6)-dimethylallyltransferase MiaA [Peptococcaceae bacterium]|nr:tRNA (adenosine(37)-N6)-dimethylallyltransferase MiaA [Peptococcaceae bacterium]